MTRPKIVKQTLCNSCVAATLAMIVGESEQYVLDWFENGDPPFSDEDAMIFLSHHGLFPFVSCGLGESNLADYDSITITYKKNILKAYTIVKSESAGLTHAVYLYKGKIYDPLFSKPQLLRNYKIDRLYPLMTTEIRLKKGE